MSANPSTEVNEFVTKLVALAKATLTSARSRKVFIDYQPTMRVVRFTSPADEALTGFIADDFESVQVAFEEIQTAITEIDPAVPVGLRGSSRPGPLLSAFLSTFQAVVDQTRRDEYATRVRAMPRTPLDIEQAKRRDAFLPAALDKVLRVEMSRKELESDRSAEPGDQMTRAQRSGRVRRAGARDLALSTYMAAHGEDVLEAYDAGDRIQGATPEITNAITAVQYAANEALNQQASQHTVGLP